MSLPGRQLPFADRRPDGRLGAESGRWARFVGLAAIEPQRQVESETPTDTVRAVVGTVVRPQGPHRTLTEDQALARN